jgi:hypothetical protein
MMTPCFVSPVFSVSFQLVRERCQVSTRSWQDAVDKTIQLALLSVRPNVVRYRRCESWFGSKFSLRG